MAIDQCLELLEEKDKIKVIEWRKFPIDERKAA